MKLNKREFEAVPGIKSYQLMDDKGLIVGVTSGFSSAENKEMAMLFENSHEMFELLKECRSAFTMLELIDKSDLSADMLLKVEKVIKKVKPNSV